VKFGRVISEGYFWQAFGKMKVATPSGGGEMKKAKAELPCAVF